MFNRWHVNVQLADHAGAAVPGSKDFSSDCPPGYDAAEMS